MFEIIINTHVHSYLSDGHATYQEIANAAASSGINGVIITDHNVHIRKKDGYYFNGNKRVLLLSGQEIHDQTKFPQKNHLLVFNPPMDFSKLADNVSQLINSVNSSGGLSFLAHPVDPELNCIGEPDISWEDWEVNGFTGIELWNGFSEIKYRSHNFLQVLFFAFFPKFLAHRPFPETMKIWDELLMSAPPCVAIGGSDAHALPKKALGTRKVIFPYTYHFSSINNHLLLPDPLSLDMNIARSQVYNAFKNGNLFIGYDYPRKTQGFRFYGQVKNSITQMGESVKIGDGITLQIALPLATECNLRRNGELVKTWNDTQNCTYITKIPGVYRVEVFLPYCGKRRGWIFSNPIYVRKNDNE